MVRLAISLLGQFEVQLDGQHVDGFRSDKIRSLLAYLAIENNRPHRREYLASLFWPEVMDATSRINLRSALTNLRQLLGDQSSQTPFLIITRDSIQFNFQSDFWLDVDQFNRLLEVGKDKLNGAGSGNLIQDELEAFETAILWYRGQFLEGLTLKDSPAFDEWAYNLRERLQHQAAMALSQLVGYYESRGARERAIQYARQWVHLTPWQEEAHVNLMRMLALNGERSAALTQYEACCRQLAEHLGVEPEKETVRLYRAIRDGQLDQLSITSEKALPAPGASPFKGLQYFDINDAGLFFGREALTGRLIARLQGMLSGPVHDSDPVRNNFLALVGASGSGKSSLARAGIAAAVKRGSLSLEGPRGHKPWNIHILTPGEHPMAILSGIEEKAYTPRLLIVDQFEEVFTLCHDEAEREAFISILLNYTDLVVITLRADFYAHCAKYPALRQALAANQEYLGVMSMEELRRAIEEPAHRNGWEFEHGLVDLFLRDIGADPDHAPEPGALPLLSYALFETWNRRNGRTMTLRGYAEAGGVHGVIAKTAETVYANLDQAQQAITQRIFLRLTELGEGTQDTRRRASLAELVPGGGSREEIAAVVKALADARLVVVEWNPASKQEDVEMAHEALIRHWPRLRGWIEEDRVELRMGERVRDAAQEWEASGKSNAMLLHRGERLETVLTLARTGQLVFNQVETDYLNACRDERERERQAYERRRGIIIFVSIVFALITGLLAVWGLLQARQANQQAEISLAQQLAAQAEELIQQPSMNEIAVLLDIESIQRHPDRSAEQLLADSLSLFPTTISKVTQSGRVTAAIFSPNGQWVASGSWDHTILVWEARTGRQIARLSLPGRVTAVAFSPDGKQIAASSDDGQAQVWDLTSGRVVAHMTCGGAIWVIDFSANGKWVATGSADGTARVWDVETGQEISRVQHSGIVYSVAFSPDGQRVVSVGSDRIVRVWDAASGQVLAQMLNQSELWVARFSPDGQSIATGGWDGVVRIWNAQNGDELIHMSHNQSVRSLAFSPHGSRIVTGSDDHTARVWDVATGRELARMTHGGRVLSVAFDRTGELVVSGSDDGTARVWSMETGQEITRLQQHGAISGVAFDPLNEMIVSGSWDGTATVWQIGSGRDIAGVQFDGGVTSISFSPDGRQVVSTSHDGSARVWDAQTGVEVSRMLHGGGVTSSAFNPDGSLVISGSQDSTARIWRPSTGQEVARMEHNQAVWAVAFSPDGKQVLTGDQDGFARVWDVQSQQEVARLNHNSPVLCVNFSPDGHWAVSGSQDGVIRVWDIATGRELHEMKHAGPVTAVVFSQDQKEIVSASQDSTVRVWSTQSGKELTRLKHQSPVNSVAISLDGRWIVSGTQGGALRVWDTKTWQEVSRIEHGEPVLSVAISPDGKLVASGSQDGKARVWLWHNEDLINLVCSRLTRNLTHAEWSQYMANWPYHRACSNLPAGN